jgi:hypothetical protein
MVIQNKNRWEKIVIKNKNRLEKIRKWKRIIKGAIQKIKKI